ncbi:MAG: nuclear transport factor 2 family protein [Novosphingobium sp.]
MAKFSPEQAADVLAIKQVIYEWGDELDIHDGVTLTEADVLTKDVRYFVGGEWQEGLPAAAKYYTDRIERLKAAGGAPVMRHVITSVRVSFDGADSAKAGYLLVFFAATGEQPFTNYCDPLAVADVKMECRREADGHWRISRFDSGQIFRRG